MKDERNDGKVYSLLFFHGGSSIVIETWNVVNQPSQSSQIPELCKQVRGSARHTYYLRRRKPETYSMYRRPREP